MSVGIVDRIAIEKRVKEYWIKKFQKELNIINNQIKEAADKGESRTNVLQYDGMDYNMLYDLYRKQGFSVYIQYDDENKKCKTAVISWVTK